MGKPLAKVIYYVIPAEAEIQKCLKILDSGSRFALHTMRCKALLARNDDLFLVPRVLQEPHLLPITSYLSSMAF